MAVAGEAKIEVDTTDALISILRARLAVARTEVDRLEKQLNDALLEKATKAERAS